MSSVLKTNYNHIDLDLNLIESNEHNRSKEKPIVQIHIFVQTFK